MWSQSDKRFQDIAFTSNCGRTDGQTGQFHNTSLLSTGISYSVLIVPSQVKCYRSVPLEATLYHCTVLSNDDVTCVQWSIFLISCESVIIQSNDKNLHIDKQIMNSSLGWYNESLYFFFSLMYIQANKFISLRRMKKGQFFIIRTLLFDYNS